MERDPRPPSGASATGTGGRFPGGALAGGLLAGIALDILTWWLARSGPQGSSGQPWSFRGNGALLVPLGLGPAILVGAWTALVLHYRSAARWRALGFGAGLVGAAFVLAGVLVLVVFGAAAQRVSDRLLVAPLGWMVLAPLLAALVPLAGGRPHRRPIVHLAAGVVFASALAARFLAAEAVVSPGS